MRQMKLMIAALLVISPIAVNADVIDFEDVAVGTGDNVILTEIISGGYLFDSPEDHIHLINDNFDAFNGTTYMAIDRAGGVIMSALSGAAFSLFALDLAEVIIGSGGSLEVFGSGGQFLSVAFDGIADGAGILNDFQTVLFDGSWVGLTSVTFVSTATNGNIAGFDNIQVNVPEPGFLALLGIGLVGMGLARRKKA